MSFLNAHILTLIETHLLLVNALYASAPECAITYYTRCDEELRMQTT